jgi:HEAT repeat protein
MQPMLKHQDHRVRVAVIEAMIQLEAQQIVPSLVGLLNDPMWDVRCAAAVALGKLRNPDSVAGLIGALRDTDNDVREAAVLSLGRIADPRAIGPLTLVLTDAESVVRRAAASALHQINPLWQRTDAAREMSPALRLALESGDLAVRYAATTTLEQLGQAASEIRGHDTATVLTTAVQKQNRVLAVFVELLNDADSDLRLAAAQSLGHLKDQRATSALIAVLSDDSEPVRRAAAEALELLGAS